jgi:hypothetical protein
VLIDATVAAAVALDAAAAIDDEREALAAVTARGRLVVPVARGSSDALVVAFRATSVLRGTTLLPMSPRTLRVVGAAAREASIMYGGGSGWSKRRRVDTELARCDGQGERGREAG